jgi:hypothetical protein
MIGGVSVGEDSGEDREEQHDDDGEADPVGHLEITSLRPGWVSGSRLPGGLSSGVSANAIGARVIVRRPFISSPGLPTISVSCSAR